MRISYRSKDELLLRFLLTKQFSLYESIIFNVSELNDRCVSYFHGRHVGVHIGGQEHGVSIQSSINLKHFSE